MSNASDKLLFELFEQVIVLPEIARASAIALLEISDQTRKELIELVAADARSDEPLEKVISASAARVNHVVDGTQLGTWRVGRELGAGGMGSVFLGERADGAFKQQVAIKFLRGFPTEEGIRRLRQERQILAQLDHPNIARLLDGGETELIAKQPFIVMEFVQGQTLTDYLKQHSLSLEARLTMFDKILQAVAHAHQRLVIHRDIKPSNVLVRDDGEPKLLDFGVAKLLEIGANTRTTSTQVMTPGYASPEQREGKAITTASDVYSLGKLLHDLLTINSKQHINAELNGIVFMASAENCSERYQTAEALREELQRYRQNMPVRAAAATRWYFFRKFVWRHRNAMGLSIIALIGLAIFTWQLAQERNRALRAEQHALESFSRANLVQRFLAGTFLGAAAKNEAGQPVSGMDLLQRAASNLQNDLSEEPEAFSEIASLIAQTYMNASDAKHAAHFAQLAIERTPAATRSVVKAARWRLLARNLATLAQYSAAYEACQNGLALLSNPPSDQEHAEVATQLRITLISVSADEESKAKLRRETHDFAQTYLPEGHYLRGTAAMHWAAQFEIDGQFAQLIDARKRVLELWAADPHAHQTDLAYQETNLARAYRLAGKYDEALSTLAAADKRFSKAMGDRMIAGRVMLLADRAEVFIATKQFAQARIEFDRYLRWVPEFDLDHELQTHSIAASLFAHEGKKIESLAALEKAKHLARWPHEKRALVALAATLN